ncbi:MAG: MFS transporter [Burkholderiaceae bacterium]|nr:MFS transporter [Burkholderiaceae bacterium]
MLEARAPRRAHLGLLIVCLGAILSPLDTTVNTAFPVIGAAFSLSLRDIQWVVIPYVLAQSSVSIVAGDLGDRFGHRRVFGIGLFACAAAHLAVAMAADWPSMIGLRIVQGAAVGMAVACAPALATLLYPPARKTWALARYAAAFSAAMAAGPWIGGLLLDRFGWPGVFWFRTPIALVALAMLPWLRVTSLMPMPSPAALAGSGTDVSPRARFGGLGALAEPGFAGLQASSVAINMACFANLLLVPYVLVQGAGVSIATAGLVLSAYPSGSVLGNLVAGRLASRLTVARGLAIGLGLTALGLLATGTMLASVPLASTSGAPAFAALALLAATMATSGFGLGLFQVGYMDATTSWLPIGNRGSAGNLVNVTRLLGLVAGAAGIGAMREALASDARSFFVLAALVLLIAASWWRRAR